MRVVVNAVPVRGTSLDVVIENILKGWDQLDVDDDVHVVVHPGVELDLPASMTLHAGHGSRFADMERRVPALCREVSAEAMFGVTPATTIGPLPCPRVIFSHDVRHEMLPHQFDPRTRLLRAVSYRLGYRRADAVVTNSHRTRADLLRFHPSLLGKTVTVAQLGADHVLEWPGAGERDAHLGGGAGYALAFGQWGNKNVGLVLEAWSLLRQEGGDQLPLVVVGLSEADRVKVQRELPVKGLEDVVTVRPWLDADEFHRQFTGASLVVFPSDYEGFGLPALEAMRLGIPVVVTPDPALFEVTGGLAVVMDGWDAPALARAVSAARRQSASDLERGVKHASEFTWRRTASVVRATLSGCVDAAATA